MECYACPNDATRQCRRCARVYCELHGGDLCGECLSPASTLPSFNLYRGSLLALLVGTAVALWLLVRPPGSGDGRVIISELTPSPVVTEVMTPDATPRVTPAEDETPGATAGRTATPRTTATEEARQYVVQDGDTLLSIAEQFAPAGVDAFTYAAQIAAASGLASVDDSIAPGQTLTLP